MIMMWGLRILSVLSLTWLSTAIPIDTDLRNSDLSPTNSTDQLATDMSKSYPLPNSTSQRGTGPSVETIVKCGIQFLHTQGADMELLSVSGIPPKGILSGVTPSDFNFIAIQAVDQSQPPSLITIVNSPEHLLDFHAISRIKYLSKNDTYTGWAFEGLGMSPEQAFATAKEKFPPPYTGFQILRPRIHLAGPSVPSEVVYQLFGASDNRGRGFATVGASSGTVTIEMQPILHPVKEPGRP